MAKRRKLADQFEAKVAVEALRGDKTIQDIAAKHQVHPNQVNTWKRQAVEGRVDVFARGGKPKGSTEAEIEELHAKIGKLAVENVFVRRREAVRPEEKHAMIKRNPPQLSISQPCKLARLSRSAF